MPQGYNSRRPERHADLHLKTMIVIGTGSRETLRYNSRPAISDK
jgi:hypothetical protein